jgi:hypothetical protein
MCHIKDGKKPKERKRVAQQAVKNDEENIELMIGLASLFLTRASCAMR